MTPSRHGSSLASPLPTAVASAHASARPAGNAWLSSAAPGKPQRPAPPLPPPLQGGSTLPGAARGADEEGPCRDEQGSSSSLLGGFLRVTRGLQECSRPGSLVLCPRGDPAHRADAPAGRAAAPGPAPCAAGARAPAWAQLGAQIWAATRAPTAASVGPTCATATACGRLSHPRARLTAAGPATWPTGARWGRDAGGRTVSALRSFACRCNAVALPEDNWAS